MIHLQWSKRKVSNKLTNTNWLASFGINLKGWSDFLPGKSTRLEGRCTLKVRIENVFFFIFNVANWIILEQDVAERDLNDFRDKIEEMYLRMADYFKDEKIDDEMKEDWRYKNISENTSIVKRPVVISV